MVKIVDLHAHVVPNCDDGATCLDESIKMLQLSIDQGVTDVFCTSHNGFNASDALHYKKQFYLLKQQVEEQNLNINLHMGCEVLMDCDDFDLELSNFKYGVYPTLGNSKYVLTEFAYYCTLRDVMPVVQVMLDGGYVPIIAHVERNQLFSVSDVKTLVDMGALVQINAHSLVQESMFWDMDFARKLLQNKLVHFVGSDAHGAERRPPNFTQGVNYLLDNVDSNYANDVLYNNAKKIILKT